MAEIAGLVIGVAGLAGLAQTCVQLAEQISYATHMPEDADSLHQKWLAEVFLLDKWRRGVGIKFDSQSAENHEINASTSEAANSNSNANTNSNGGRLGAPPNHISHRRHNSQGTSRPLKRQRLEPSLMPIHSVEALHHSNLDDTEVRKQILNTLRVMERLLRSQEKLVSKYGLGTTLTIRPKSASQSCDVSSNEVSQHSGDREVAALDVSFDSGTQSYNGGSASLITRVRWVIKDKQKFEKLVLEMAFLVEQLYRLIDPLLEVVISNRQALADIAAFVKDRMDKLELVGENLEARMGEKVQVEANLRDIISFMTKDEREKTLQWLQPISTKRKWDQTMRDTCPDTCQWLIERQRFLEWARMVPSHDAAVNSRPIFWLQGNAGTGKTFLAAKVVKYFLENSALPFAYIFCTFDSASKQIDSILSSWIGQVASQRTKALELVSVRRAESGLHPPTVTDLWSIFKDLITSVENCYFLVDGFDETLKSDPDSAESTADDRAGFLNELVSAIKGTSARVIIVSRPLQAFREVLLCPEGPTISFKLRSAYTASDVNRFTNAAVTKQLGARDHEKNAMVASRLAEKAGGMFLWVHLEIPRLKRSATKEELSQILDEMPEGSLQLQRAYDRNLETVLSQQDPRAVRRALSALRWTMYQTGSGRGRLKIDEILDVVSLEDRRPGWKPRYFDKVTLEDFRDEMLAVCTPLIRYIGDYSDHGAPDGYFAFSHFSVEEYLRALTSQRMCGLTPNGFLMRHYIPLSDSAACHAQCALSCREYFESPTVKDAQMKETTFAFTSRLPNLPFLEYAARRLLDHVRDSDGIYFKYPGDWFVEPTPDGRRQLRRWLSIHCWIVEPWHRDIELAFNDGVDKVCKKASAKEDECHKDHAYTLWMFCMLKQHTLALQFLLRLKELSIDVFLSQFDQQFTSGAGLLVDQSSLLVACVLVGIFEQHEGGGILEMILEHWPSSLSIDAPFCHIVNNGWLANLLENCGLNVYPNALTMATILQYGDTVELLLRKAHADPNFSVGGSDPPLSIALKYKGDHEYPGCQWRYKIVTHLVEAGAVPTAKLLRDVEHDRAYLQCMYGVSFSGRSFSGQSYCMRTRKEILSFKQVNEEAEGQETDEHGTDEHGTDEHGTDEHGTDEHGTDEHGTDEHGTDEHGSDEHGSDEHGSDEHGSDEHGSDEHGTDEHDADEHDADEHDVDELGTDEHGTDEHDADELGTDEHGTDEHETDEHDADEMTPTKTPAVHTRTFETMCWRTRVRETRVSKAMNTTRERKDGGGFNGLRSRGQSKRSDSGLEWIQA